jgi:hypothetical protein
MYNIAIRQVNQVNVMTRKSSYYTYKGRNTGLHKHTSNSDDELNSSKFSGFSESPLPTLTISLDTGLDLEKPLGSAITGLLSIIPPFPESEAFGH